MNDILHGGEWKENDIKTDFSVNINPLGVPDEVREFLTMTDPSELLTRYPDRGCAELRESIAQKFGVDKEHVICGNGASELIMNIIKALADLGTDRIFLPIPSFLGYERSLNSCFEDCDTKIVYHALERSEDFKLTGSFLTALGDFAGDGDNDYAKTVILCNPNNPTGSLIDKDIICEIVRICKEHRVRLVMDECFLGFCDEENDRSLKRLSENDPGICVVDAFTKLYAIPGIRLGFMISGDDKLNKKVKDLIPEWNVSLPAQEIGKIIIGKVPEKYLSDTRMLLKTEREYICNELHNMGFRVYPGDANFILFRPQNKAGCGDLQKKLAGDGILIRNCGNYRGLDEFDMRIAVRDHEDNKTLIEVLRKYAPIPGRGR